MLDFVQKEITEVQENPYSSVATPLDWNSINWQKLEKQILKLQQKVFHLQRNEQLEKVRYYQDIILRSNLTLLLSIRVVTQMNKGGRTPGIDGYRAVKATERVSLYNHLVGNSIYLHQPSPARRLYIEKKNGKLRPLGIPTIIDRVYQGIVKMALEPQWEALFEPNSYGFRPKRSAHDAIENIRQELDKKEKLWVFEGDFKSCFDSLDHDFIMKQIEGFPAKNLIKKWLKAGYMEDDTFYETEKGTPQGGIISPLLANIALHGMEEAIGNKANLRHSIVRYADDFVILCETKEDAEEMYERLQPYLTARGLALEETKTRVVHICEGFDFLGFNIKSNTKVENSLLITPSDENLKKCKNKVTEAFQQEKRRSLGKIISMLNLIIRGYGNYWKWHIPKEIFSDIDQHIYERAVEFLTTLHPTQTLEWIHKCYFKPDKHGLSKDTFLLTDPKHSKVQLMKMNWFLPVNHRLVEHDASPYNKNLQSYFRERALQRHDFSCIVAWQKLAKNQNHICPFCGQSIIDGKGLIEKHHKVPKLKGGEDSFQNQVLVHLDCHQAWHRTFPREGELPSLILSKAWLRSWRKNINDKTIDELSTMLNVEKFLNCNNIKVYVDGSYNLETAEYGGGIVAFNKGIKETFSIKGEDTEMASMRNVAGEIEAAIFAINYAMKKGVKALTIYYDYEGIEKWATGEWKAKRKSIQAYKKLYAKAKEKMVITFWKVKAHNGVIFNEEADRLAKKAVGIS